MSTSSYLHKNLAIELGNLWQGRAVEAVALWAGEAGVEADFDMTVCSGLHLQPSRLGTVLAEELGIAQSRVVVAGPYDDRLLLIEVGSGTWVAASLSSPSLRESALPVLVREGLALKDADKAVTLAHPGDDMIERLTRPRVVLISLFKPSVFPLPRFALGVSDIARAVRHSFAGQVEVIDMQFGLGVEDVARKVHDLE